MHIHRRRLIVASALLAGLAAPALADVRAGITAWEAGDYGAAITQWRPLANKGDAVAQFNMGQAYRLGRGVPVDLGIARTWFEKAAQQGHEKAQSNLGLLLFQVGDRKTAMYWIAKAADRGDPRAQYLLGTALFNGDGLTRDWPRAYALMSRAAAQGLGPAQTSLGQMEKHMLLADREKGADLARQMEKGGAALSRSAAAMGSPADGPKIVVEPGATADTSILAAAPALRKAPKAAPPAAKAPIRTARAAPAPARAAMAVQASPGGRWRVQLGAFDSPAAARIRWTALARSMPSLSGLQPSYEAHGALTRLRAGPLAGKADADRLCAAAKASGQACFTVRP